MQLLLPSPLIERLLSELKRAGSREIGGLLMGEHVRDEVFRIVDISVQRSGGNIACFIRHPKHHKKMLNRFFSRTGDDYTRFNYLGEWHSHPRFEPVPSGPDIRTMQSLVADPATGVNFLILLIARQDDSQRLEVTATAFSPNSPPLPVSVETEAVEGPPQGGLLTRWVQKIFSL
jgi:integrative and conjugative element protein (TIGR02256 family)